MLTYEKILIESLRCLITGLIFWLLFLTGRNSRDIRQQDGWYLILMGFGLMFFATAIDITDNFPFLNRFVLIGNTPLEAILEKVFGYLLGTTLIFYGFLRWLPLVTNLKKKERQLAESEHKYRQSIENSPVAIFSIDREFRIISSNNASALLFKQDLSGKYLLSLCNDPEHQKELKKYADRVLKKGEVFKDREIRFIDAEGSELTVSCTLYPIYDASSTVSKCVFSCIDITEKLKMEEQLQRSYRLESLSVFAGGIAHDFNNLLAGILGNISLASMLAGDKHVSERLQEAEKACARAEALASQLLMFARELEPAKEVCYIGDTIRDASEFVLSGSDVRLTVDIAEDLLPVEADVNQIAQVIQNLVLNAKDAIGQGGEIKVVADNIIEEKRGRRFVRIRVSDNGNGIEPELLKKIFDPFFTTKNRGNKKGTGLGLSIAHSIVEKHGGKIDVDSAPGRGTTFTILLPASDRPADTEKNSEDIDRTDIDFAGRRVLIMDDDEMVLDVATEMFRTMGFDVQTATSGTEAIKKCKEAFQQGQGIDLVVLDLTVAGGDGAKQCVKDIRRLSPEIKAVVTSGYPNDPVMLNHREYGFQKAVKKPFRYEELYASMKELFT